MRQGEGGSQGGEGSCIAQCALAWSNFGSGWSSRLAFRSGQRWTFLAPRLFYASGLASTALGGGLGAPRGCLLCAYVSYDHTPHRSVVLFCLACVTLKLVCMMCALMCALKLKCEDNRAALLSGCIV